MTIEHLRYFLTIAKYQNLTRASEELLIAQSALSMTLSRMEEKLGVPLFDRDKKKIRLNQYGLELQKRAAIIIQEYDKALTEINHIKHASESTLNIGVADWGFPQYLLSQFPILHPEIHININLCYSPDIAGLFHEDILKV